MSIYESGVKWSLTGNFIWCFHTFLDKWDPSTVTSVKKCVDYQEKTVEKLTKYGYIPQEYLEVPMNFSANPYICVCVHAYVCVHIYIERERERERESGYIYIYI